jgi:hypothetical protein
LRFFKSADHSAEKNPRQLKEAKREGLLTGFLQEVQGLLRPNKKSRFLSEFCWIVGLFIPPRAKSRVFSQKRGGEEDFEGVSEGGGGIYLASDFHLF